MILGMQIKQERDQKNIQTYLSLWYVEWTIYAIYMAVV
jgi:hypothetical protein